MSKPTAFICSFRAAPLTPSEKDEIAPLHLLFQEPCPRFETLDEQQAVFTEAAEEIITAMLSHLPGALIDAIGAQIWLRRASELLVAKRPISILIERDCDLANG